MIVFIANVTGGLFAATLVPERRVSSSVLIGGAIVAGVVALDAIVWTFLAGRGRVTSRALPHGVTVVAILLVATIAVVWARGQNYAAIAMGSG